MITEPPHVENPVDPGEWVKAVVSADALGYLKQIGKRLVFTMKMRDGYPDLCCTEIDAEPEVQPDAVTT